MNLRKEKGNKKERWREKENKKNEKKKKTGHGRQCALSLEQEEDVVIKHNMWASLVGYCD